MNLFLKTSLLGALAALLLPNFAVTPSLSATAPQTSANPAPAPKAAKKPKSEKWSFSFLPIGLQRNPKVDYTIYTEMTDAGRELPEPSFDKPVYYISHAMSQHDAGDAPGGTKDIPYQKIQEILNTSLASNGYRPSDDSHPPAQVFIFAWGMHNKIEFPEGSVDEDAIFQALQSSSSFSGDDDLSRELESFTPSADDIRKALENLVSRAKIVGGAKFANEVTQALVTHGFSAGNIIGNIAQALTEAYADGSIEDASDIDSILDETVPEAFPTEVEQAFTAHNFRNFSTDKDLIEALCYAVESDCYYLLVTSLDADALRRGQKKILWITHITTVSQGISFEKTLPIMINNAAYYFGRETKVPEVVLKRAYKNASVDIGEAQVVEYISGSTFSTGTAGTTGTAKPATSGTISPATSGTANAAGKH